MNKKTIKTLLVFTTIFMLLLNGCGPAPTPQVVEVTKIVEGEVQTVVITATPAPVEEEMPAELPEKIIVGALQPLTGTHAPFGSEAKIGIELAVKHINEAGGIKSMGGIPLELVVEDAGENADSARLGAESIISKHHPVAIFGTYISRMTAAASEVTDREQVFLIADALVDSITQMGRRYLFRPGPKASQHGMSSVRFVMEMAEKQGLEFTKVAIINEDSAFGRANTMGALDEAINWGLTTVYQKEYPYDITDATTIVNEIENSGADFIVHCPYFNDAIVFAKGFSESDKIPKFIAGMGACGYTDPQSIEQLGDMANIYTNTYSYNPAKDTEQNKKFVEEFKAQMGYIPTEGAGMNYYDVWTFKEALELSGTMFPDDPLNPENLRAAMLALDLTSGPAVDTFPGTRIAFTEAGDNPDAIAVIYQVQDGLIKVVWPVDVAEAEAIFPRLDSTY